MDRSRSTSGIDFVVTFFLDNRMVSRLLSDILKNRDNPLFLEAMGLPRDFRIPFSRMERGDGVVYTVKQDPASPYEVLLQASVCREHEIRSGDYFTLRHSLDQSIVAKILILATSDIETAYRKYSLPKSGHVTIGYSLENDIVYHPSFAAAREVRAVIRLEKDHGVVENLNPRADLFVNGQRAVSQQLKPFDEICIMGLSIVYMGSFLAVRNLKTESTLPLKTSFRKKSIVTAEDRKPFVSTPRILKSLDIEEIEIDAPPNPFTMDKTPAILTIGPALTMSLAMLASLGVSITNAINGGQLSTIIVSGTMAVGMLLGALMWPSLLRRYQKKRIAAEEFHRKNRYMSYIADIEKELVVKKDRAMRLLNDTLCPSPEILCSMLDSEANKLRLWERSDEDEDFLDIRMGLGSRPFGIRLKTPKQGFQLYEDELRNLPVELTKKYGILNDVPMTLDIFHNRTVGVIGDKDHMQSILNETILNIIALHSSEEVKLVLITPPKQAHQFEIFKNVPHIWSNDKKVRFFASNPDEVHYIFNILNEILKQRESADNPVKPIPHYVVIVTEPTLIEKEALLRYLNDAENQVGVTTLFAYGDITKLPKACKTIVLSDDNRTGYYIKNKNANRFIPFVLDDLDTNRINAFVSKLSQLPIKRDVRSMGIVDRISFLQMYKAGNVEALNIESHWENNNSAKSLAVPIGVMTGGEVFNLDLHESYHGCHGLVAGTTGSGKSEFLQAFILSLAINYSPKEVAFVLVDFKGGDMARPFMAKPFAPALPHLAATISNLSGNILYRALVSLEAEIKSRQRIFNESAAILGVDKLDINSYHKYYKGGRLEKPLPHLVIIIDEFAQLKTQQPEFLTQLVNVAQVGRSLGIHLILATQKPSGIVDPQIMSNSRFKVCLKVADKQDSIDMINKPDSARIKNPGRMYLQVGYDEIYECVQSGYSGAEYVPTKTYMPDEEITVQMTDNTSNPIHSARIDLSTEKSSKTQLEAVVAEIVALGQKKGITAKPLWLDMLPEKVVLNTLKRRTRGLCSATIGLADYVRTQEQKSLSIDFAKTGHIGLYGASGTGKTTFLQTLVYSMVCDYGYTPEELNLYAMDFGGRNLGYLSDLPHTGGVVFADDEQKLSELVAVLQSIIDERKRTFAANNCGTFAEYRAISPVPMPAVLVLIDNYASFREKYMDLADELTGIISSGKTFGVYFVITGSTRNAIYYRVTEHISSYFTLRMNDPANYMDIHNVRPPVTPEDISGRGITVVNREVIEFQTAIVCDGETEADRMNAITREYAKIAEGWHGFKPVKLGVTETEQETEEEIIPLQIRKSNPPEAISDDAANLILGASKTSLLLYGINLTESYKLCLCANENEMLGAYFRMLLKSISRYPGRQIVFLDVLEAFKTVAAECPGCRYISSVAALDAYIEELKPELNARLDSQGDHHDQLFVLIPEFNAFFDRITDEQAEFMRKVVRYINDPKYKICFVCGYNVGGSKNNDRLFVELVVNAENYILCPNSYGRASEKIETIPLIASANDRDTYFCAKEKNIEIRW